MRSKAPLVMMEQMVMLLVFALAAALCLQAFSKSDGISKRVEARDHAVTLCESVAELAKNSGEAPDDALAAAAGKLGYSFENGVLMANFDEDWNMGADGVYHLTAQAVPSDIPGLYSACVTVEHENDVLFELTVAWQGEGIANE